jgi:hypothetical protein
MRRAFEANVPWRILDAEGAEVEAGFTMTSEGQTFAPFSFEVELPGGRVRRRDIGGRSVGRGRRHSHGGHPQLHRGVSPPRGQPR